MSFGGLACRPTGAVKYTFTIIHNINKLKQGNARISKANKIKDIMLINSYVTHHNRYIQYKQNLTTCKAHIYRPHKKYLTQHNILNIYFQLNTLSASTCYCTIFNAKKLNHADCQLNAVNSCIYFKQLITVF